MDEDTIIERIRADADELDASRTDINALVQTAVLQGHRRRTRRRVAGGVTGLVAAALVVSGVTVGVRAGLHSGPTVVPAAPVPSLSSSQSLTQTPAAPTPTGRVLGSPNAVRKTLTGLLPDSLRVTDASASRDENSDGFAWEHNAALTVQDRKGMSYLVGGIGNGAYSDGCYGLADCQRHSLPGGGTLWITGGLKVDKSGVDRTFRYNRPNGGHVWLMERNYAGGSEPVSRNGLPLSDTTGRRLVTSASWDALFQG